MCIGHMKSNDFPINSPKFESVKFHASPKMNLKKGEKALLEVNRLS